MNPSELKQEIIKKIDSMSESDFEKVYQQLLLILKPSGHYTLTKEEKEAIDSALIASEKGETYTHDEVSIEAKKKYPNLKFK